MLLENIVVYLYIGMYTCTREKGHGISFNVAKKTTEHNEECLKKEKKKMVFLLRLFMYNDEDCGSLILFYV